MNVSLRAINRDADNVNGVVTLFRQKIECLLDEYPGWIETTNNVGELPLHYAVGAYYLSGPSNRKPFCCPLLLRLLIQRYPAATRATNAHGYLPINLAIANENFDAATVLIENHQGNIDPVPPVPGRWPLLHSALSIRAPPNFIQLLLQNVPGCAEVKFHGVLPIQGAIIFAACSLETLDLLVDAYPAGLTMVCGEHKRTLLHLALFSEEGGCSDRVVAWLIDKCPKLVTISDKSGDLPLHYAAHNSALCPLSVFYRLVKENPPSLKK